MNKLLLWCLLVTFCLNTAGCSNDMTILNNNSKPSTPTKVKCINKAWYKNIYPVIVYDKGHKAKLLYINPAIKML